MVTPDDARGLARVIDENPIGKSDKYLSEALRDLATQVESLQADAERYRWLRVNGITGEVYTLPPFGVDGAIMVIAQGEQLDAAIDEARKQS